MELLQQRVNLTKNILKWCICPSAKLVINCSESWREKERWDEKRLAETERRGSLGVGDGEGWNEERGSKRHEENRREKKTGGWETCKLRSNYCSCSVNWERTREEGGQCKKMIKKNNILLSRSLTFTFTFSHLSAYYFFLIGAITLPAIISLVYLLSVHTIMNLHMVCWRWWWLWLVWSFLTTSQWVSLLQIKLKETIWVNFFPCSCL